MVAGPSIDDHHLIPKSKKGKLKETCHKVCHRAIHSAYSEKELAREFNTWAKLRVAPALQGFLKWIAKKPPEFIDAFRDSKGKGGRR